MPEKVDVSQLVPTGKRVNPNKTNLETSNNSEEFPDISQLVPTGKRVNPNKAELMPIESPEFIPISDTENFINRFGLKKDEIELSMYQGFDAKAKDIEGSIADTWRSFLKNRIDSNKEDIANEVKHIKWSEEDMKPFVMSDLINRPSHFFSNQLPELLGQSIGSMTEPIIAGSLAGAAVGSAIGPEGTVLGLGAGYAGGMAAGLVGMFTGRFLESMSEAGSAYNDAVKYIKDNNKGLDDKEVHRQAIEVLDHVFNKNMALGVADIPELLLAFTPASRLLGKFGSQAFRKGFAIAKTSAVPFIEAAEEGLQYYISETGLNKVRKEKDKQDVSLTGMWNNDEFQTSIQSGFLLGGMLGGVGKVTEKVWESKKLLDGLPEEEKINQLSELGDEYIYKKAQARKSDQLIGMIKDWGEMEAGPLSDMNTKDTYARIGDSKQKARDVIKNIKEKVEIHNAVVANKNISTPEGKLEAYKSQIEISKIDKAVDQLSSAEDLNKGEIAKLELKRKHLGEFTQLLGEGYDRKKDTMIFKELALKHKEEVIKFNEKQDGKFDKKPVAAKSGSVSNESKSSGDVQSSSKEGSTKNNRTTEKEPKIVKTKKETNIEEATPGDYVEVNTEEGQGLIKARYSDFKNNKVIVRGEMPDGSTKVMAVHPDDISLLPKEKKELPILHIQDKNMEKVMAGIKTSTSRTRTVSDIKPGKYRLKNGVEVKVGKAFKYDNISEMKDPETWAKQEGFESLDDLKANAKKDIKDFAEGKNKHPLWFHTFELPVEHQKKNAEEALPKFKASDSASITTEEAEKETPKVKAKRTTDDLVKKLESLKVDLKSGPNDISRVLPGHAWNAAVSVVQAGVIAHGSLKRAIKEAIEDMRNSEWYKKLNKKKRSASEAILNASLEKMINEEDGLGRKIAELNKKYDSDIENEEREIATTYDEELSEILDEYFEEYREAGMQYEDNDSRARALVKSIRNLYKDIDGVSEKESLDALYDLFHDAAFDESDIRKAITSLKSEPLKSHLSHATNAELIQLSNAIKNIVRVPFLHHFNIGNKEFKPFVSNISREIISETIRSVDEKLKNTDSIQKRLDKFYRVDVPAIFKKYGNGDINKAYRDEKAKAEIYDSEIKLLKDLTGEDWSGFLDNTVPRDAKEKTYREYYINNKTFTFKGNQLPLQQSFAKKLLIKTTASEFIAGMRGKADYKSNVSKLASLKASNTEAKLGNYFDNIMNKKKSGFALRSHIIDAANEIHTVKKDYLKDNTYVNYFKEKAVPAKVFIYDGIKSRFTGKKEEAGELSENDLMLSILLNFVDNGNLLDENEFLFPVEQLSDKKQTVFVQAPKYTLDQLKTMVKSIDKAFVPSSKEVTTEIEKVKTFIEKNIENKSLAVDKDPEVLAKEFVYNYMVNKNYIDEYFQGKPSNYFKKGKFDYVSQVKRAGSAHSSGQILNLKVKNGIGETSNHIVVSNVMKDVNGKSHDIADGQTFHTEDWNNRVKVSSGDMFHSILKPIYSTVNNAGDRILIKSNSILLTKEYVEDKPVLKNLLDLMTKNKADFLTVESGVKHDIPEQVTKIDWNTGLPSGKVNVIPRDNKNWRIQQDFNQPEVLDWKRLTKQMMRHFMDFKNSPKMQKLFNDAVSKVSDELKEEFSQDPESFRSFLIDNIEDNDTNKQVLDLLKAGTSIDHAHLRNFIPTIVSSVITKKVLDIKGNGAIYIEVSSVGNDLKGLRIEGDKVLPGEVLVPENSGLKIGDKLFATRVPSSNHHSTDYSIVKGFTPKEMGNAIVMNADAQQRAGSDFDGDARHIWAPFKNNSSVAKSMNEAFNLAVEEYENPENFDRITSPIDIESIKETLKNSDFKEQIGSKYFVSSLLQMYRNNKDGKKVVGIVATSSKIFSFLRAHNAVLKTPITMPVIRNGKLSETITLSSIKKDDTTKETIANNINQAVDAAKEQNLEAMGMNEFGASIYNLLEQLGMDEESVINFMALPAMREYMNAMRDSRSVNSNITEFQVLNRLIDDKSSTIEYSDPEEQDVDVESIENDLQVLQKIKELVYISNDYFTFGSVINLTEKSPKSFPELYKYGNDFKKVSTNNTNFSLQNVKDSPYIHAAKRSLELSKKFYRGNTIYGTKKAKAIIDFFEKQFSFKMKAGQKSLNKSQIQLLSDAIGSLAMAEHFKNEKKKEQVIADVQKEFSESKEPNKFLDLLEIDRNKLGLKSDAQRREFDNEEMEEIKAAFSSLPEDFKNDLVLNTFYEHGLLSSRKAGGYSFFFDNATHAGIGNGIEQVKKSWDSNDALSSDELKAIVKNNPDLIPDANFSTNQEKMLPRDVKQLDNFPKYMKKKIGNKYKVFARLKDARGVLHFKDESKFNFEIPITQDVKTYELPAEAKLQSSSKEKLASEDVETRDAIREQFVELYPNANVKFIDHLTDVFGNEALGAQVGNTFYINPNKEVQSTYFDVFALGYWDALPDNDSVKVGLLELFGTEEKAIQAIGEAGVDIAKVSLKKGSLARFKGLLQSFWRKVKAVFKISSKEDLARTMAERIWTNQDKVDMGTLKSDIIKYQMSQTAQDAQDVVTKKLEEELSKPLDEIVTGDLDILKGIDQKIEAEIAEKLPEGKTLEEVMKSPKELFHILAGKQMEPLSKSEYSVDRSFGIYSKLNKTQKLAIDKTYEKYLADVKAVDTFWSYFPTVKDFNKTDSTEVKRIFTKLAKMDPIARGVLYDTLTNKYFESRLVNEVRNENSQGFEGYKAATMALNDLIYTNPEDFKYQLSKWFTSANDLKDTHKALQWHTRLMGEDMSEAQMKWSEVARELITLEKAVKEEGGSLKNITEKQGSFVSFKKSEDKSLTPAERKYIEFVNSINRENGRSGKAAGLVPQVTSNFFDLMKKFGFYKAFKESVFGNSPYDGVNIRTTDGEVMTLQEAKQVIELSKNKGILDNIRAIKQIHTYEAQAENIYKNKKIDEAGVFWDNTQDDSISLNYNFKESEFASENINSVMVAYFKDLIFKNKMEGHIVLSTYMKKHYDSGTTKYVREWLENFYGNNIFKRNPESVLGKYDKYLNWMLNFTAWRYLAMNPMGMVFNLSAGLTQSFRELGPAVMLRAIKRMGSNPRKFAQIMKNQHVVSIDIDAELNQSSKNFKKLQNIMFSTITIAEYINQGYTYIGMMSEEEWNDYNSKGILIPGRTGITSSNDFLYQSMKDEINGAYSSLLRRPISYTSPGRALMQFKGWMPDVLLAHFRSEGIDKFGKVRKGIVWTVIDPSVWSKMLKGLKNKEEWNKLSEIDKKNLTKATRELIMSGMLLMLMAAMDDDDDENKALISGMRRVLGDVTYVFDLDNVEFLFDSPIPVLGTMIDVKKAFEALLKGTTYKRNSGDHEKGDLMAIDKLSQLSPGSKMLDELGDVMQGE